MKFKRHCSTCGKLFEGEFGRYKFCSKECLDDNTKKYNVIKHRQKTDCETRVVYYQYCSICGKKFERKSNNVRYCGNTCVNKANDEHKKWKRQNNERVRDVINKRGRRYAAERRLQLTTFILDYKKERCCTVCGLKDYRVLDFHHQNPKEKEWNIPKMVGNKCTLDGLKKEIAKCVLVCRNCHAIIHYDETHGAGIKLI